MEEPGESARLSKIVPLPSAGSSLHWRNLTINVPLDHRTQCTTDVEQPRPTSKSILKDVSGYIEPGQLLFIMGPSGSGKSTILDALSDRIKLPVEGVQFLNGRPKSPHALKAVAKYVQQTDDLLGVLTVKETLDLAAALYITDAPMRSSAVFDVMDIFGLTAHAHTKIGNSFVRGLSSGQIRRVSIGLELLATPQILFLDEPTSGLDSATAYNVMSELRRIAKLTSMAMVITVHQPSELVFEMADTLLLITEGQMCYFGAANRAANYFRSLGLIPSPRASDIEWMLDLINRDFGRHETVDKCLRAWSGSPSANELSTKLYDAGVPHKASECRISNFGPVNYPVSFFQQIKVLTTRGLLNTIRNPAVLWLRFAMYMLLSLMIGLVWLRLGRSASDIIDTNNALFYTCAFMIFMSVSVLPAYLEERAVLMRERANGAYSVGAYVLSHLLYEIPYILLLAIMASAITYFMLGLTSGKRRFFTFVANLFISLLASESMMLLISTTIPILTLAIAAGAMIFGVFMCVQGAFISVERIGWWLRWMRYIALHFYSYSTFLVNQHRGQTYAADPDNQFPSYPEDVKGESVYQELGLEQRIWVNFVAQIAMIIFYRAVAAVWLNVFAKGKK